MALKMFLVVLTVLIAGGLSLSIKVPSKVGEKIDGVSPQSLVYLGTADGKSFFAETTRMNWTVALEYCNSYRMKLASVTTSAQLDVLRGAYNEEYFIGLHWTSGRDAQEFRQFSWHYTEEEVDKNIMNGIKTESDGIKSCLSFSSGRGSDQRFRFDDCLYNYHVICETS